MSESESLFPRSTFLLVALASAPLVMLVVECTRSAYSDSQLIMSTAVRTEMARLRSQVMRRAGQLEVAMSLQGGNDLDTASSQSWFQNSWDMASVLDPHQLYAALVDPSGKIVLHSDPKLVGRRLDWKWYDKSVADAGTDVVLVTGGVLAEKGRAYDLRVPLYINGHGIGEYHAGLDEQWISDTVSTLRQPVMARSALLLGFAVVVSALGGAALFFLFQRLVALQSRLQHEPARLYGMLGRIAGGLAHEIRNPLHALRINLFALQRSQNGRTPLEPDDLTTLFQQSDHAIESIEGLMRDMLQFTAPCSRSRDSIDVVREVQATLNLMSDEMRRRQIDVQTNFPEIPVCVAVDPGQLRQVLMNLLTFAQNNVRSPGRIGVEVSVNEAQAEISVADNGSLLTTEQQEHLFEPFQAPRETGSALGLAFVQSFAVQSRGFVMCENTTPPGCRFRIVLPAASISGKA